MHWTFDAHEDLIDILARFGPTKRKRLLAELGEAERWIGEDSNAGSPDLFIDLAASEEFARAGRIVTFGHESDVVIAIVHCRIRGTPTIFGCFLADDLLSALDP
ncbi:MAG: hypothetical protein KF884_02250 [Fimbriimonadaceae bacterium]|nr:hypothetical protein [Fimbriimonadaceae bacterium]QYK58917.1 MAG: hypothetical protein KF884_02250 [Fimbriimonadaceae bacterium]